MVTKKDILDLSIVPNVVLTEKELQWIMDNYESWQKTRPMDSWEKIVEELIYSRIDLRLERIEPLMF